MKMVNPLAASNTPPGPRAPADFLPDAAFPPFPPPRPNCRGGTLPVSPAFFGDDTMTIKQLILDLIGALALMVTMMGLPIIMWALAG